MKKVPIFLIVILALTFISISCSKEEDDNPIIDDGLITLSDLDGSWNFVSYNYKGTDNNCIVTLTK